MDGNRPAVERNRTAGARLPWSPFRPVTASGPIPAPVPARSAKQWVVVLPAGLAVSAHGTQTNLAARSTSDNRRTGIVLWLPQTRTSAHAGCITTPSRTLATAAARVWERSLDGHHLRVPPGKAMWSSIVPHVNGGPGRRRMRKPRPAHLTDFVIFLLQGPVADLAFALASIARSPGRAPA